ncbi:zinc finger CCHC domain-containing protein 8 homolog isoform X2 [Calliopsis andreniformis]|uniref:zinc finger CCHC domain-containing protein 8 homolog isoform X2 n=1 Tax=Calliopsis andreniformis TaxID=337506 RepID=UPI003FCCB29A
MNSTITIGDTDDEVIDLDSSQDTINVVDNDQSELSIETNSLPNKTDTTDTTDGNEENNEDSPKPQACDNASVSKPLLRVMFRDESTLRQYGDRIKVFIEGLISCKVETQENEDSLTLEIWENDVDQADSTSQSVEISTESEDSQGIICDTLFTVDTQPKLKDDLDVPTYGKKYENAFEKTNQEEKKPQIDCAPKVMCFNCTENHNLRDCPKPRNQANINKNRKNFNMKGNSRTLRYHLGDDQKFGHMIPGQISNNLRKALGLRDYELPRHIYRMRTLGYPPGWLEEARLQHSGITLFNSDGVAEGDPNEEPGAIFDEGDRDQYDMKKIFDFPGFNVPPPPGTRDENGQYWASHMQTVHSKQTMLLMLNGKQADDGYKRKKLKISNNSMNDNPASVSAEMEIEDVEESPVECVPINGLFVPPLPKESIAKPPEPPSQPSEDSDCYSQELQFSDCPTDRKENNASPTSRTNSPSLSDLENMKKRLLVELQKSSPQLSAEASSKSNDLDTSVKSDMPPPSNEVTPEPNRTRRNTLNSSHGSVKSVDLGTPVLKSSSPYNKLPSSEKFSKNICDVINFENLPDSTGKYEQMVGVLQKVRNTLARLQQD